MLVTGRRVLLTGATGGIGQAIARRLHAAGAHLILTGRRTDVLEPLAGELGAQVVAADLAQRPAVETLVAAAGDIDILVANAALPASGDLRSFSVEQIDRALDVNLRAPVVLARELAGPMIERGSGHIVLVSSLSGKAGVAGGSLYSATKFGMRGFGQGLRADLRRHGVGVSVVFPGFIRDAGMFHESGATLPGYVGTSTAGEVADGVLRAIERDRGEVDVAPLRVRASIKLSELLPGAAARFAERMGGDRVADEMARGQAAKR